MLKVYKKHARGKYQERSMLLNNPHDVFNFQCLTNQRNIFNIEFSQNTIK